MLSKISENISLGCTFSKTKDFLVAILVINKWNGEHC